MYVTDVNNVPIIDRSLFIETHLLQSSAECSPDVFKNRYYQNFVQDNDYCN